MMIDEASDELERDRIARMAGEAFVAASRARTLEEHQALRALACSHVNRLQRLSGASRQRRMPDDGEYR